MCCATSTPVIQNLGNTISYAAATLGVPVVAATGQTVGEAQDKTKSLQCVSCTTGVNLPRSGTFTTNGITVTTSFTGVVQVDTNNTINPYVSCGVTVPGGAKNVGAAIGPSSAPWSYKFVFDKPVNNVIYFIGATGAEYNENFIFNGNGGTVSITPLSSCDATITGNQIISGGNLPYGSTGGGGVFVISSPTNFTQLTINGNGGASGSLLNICANSITSPTDLMVTKTDNTTTYTSGTTNTYTIIAKNNGLADVTNAIFVDNLPVGIPPANVTYAAVASAGSSTTVIGVQTGAINDLITLPVGGTVTYTVNILVPAGFSGNLTNTATITLPVGYSDTNTTNNTATDINTQSTGCPPNPYTSQQTWWIPNSFSDEAVRLDFQTGSAVLNNPATGFLGQGATTLGFEGSTAVTHPVTGELLFVTDGNSLYKGATGVLASGSLVGGNGSAGEAAAVIPDPQGILGRDFIIFGNSTTNIAGTLRSAKYNLETNTVSNVTTLLPASSIYEALEVIPHTNGTDYWILVNTADQKVKSYLYSSTSGFNATAVSTTDVANLAGVNPTYIATESFISWDPRNAGKVLIARHNKIGLANFDPSTGLLGTWDVKVTVTSGTVDDNANTGYSAALSPNGRYIYYLEYISVSNLQVLKYYDLTTSTTTTLDSTVGPPTGIKIAPDGKLYRTGFAGGINQLYYINANANTPPTAAGSQVLFPTGGRELGLQLPNNTYWACATCQSGTTAPTLASTNITSNPATVADLIAILSASNQPVGTAFTIHSNATATDANKLANSTAIVAGTTYYVAFYDGLAICYSPTIAVTVASSFCYKPAVLDAGNTYPTKHGITALGRAGAENDNWPMVRQSAWTVLEAKTKGFVVNRVKFNASNQPVATDGTTLVITTPVEGMMVYDTTNNCLKVYTSTDGTTFAWYCMTTQTCPQ